MPLDEQHSLQFMQSFDEEFPIDDIAPDDLKTAALLLHLRGPNQLSGWLMRLATRLESWNKLKKRLEN